MKKLAIISLVVFLVAGCKKDIASLNVNPKAAVSVPASSVFLNGEKNLVDAYTTPSVSSNPYRVIAQTWSEHTYVYEAQYKFSQYNAPSGWWNNLYGTVLNNLEQAKFLFPASITDPVKLRNSIIITDILEVYTYNLLVSTYGNIPYSEAENRTIPFPKYDDAKTVTLDLLKRLDSCIAGLNTSGTAMGTADQIYSGDVSKWKKFAGSLKLKIAMLIADKDLSTATAKAQEAVTSGVLSSNAVYSSATTDNARFAYQSNATVNTNPIYQAISLSGRHDFGPASLLINTMVQSSDPRLPLFFTPFPTVGSYKGLVAGAGNGYGNFSDFAAPLYSSTFPGILLDVSETEFLLAEATARGINVGGTVESHYNAGITASIIFWGGTVANATVYLAQPSVAYTTATGSWQQKIATQMWISYWNRGWDAWTVIRRFGYPNIDLVSPPVGAVGKFPIRFTYPQTEQSSNPTNWTQAVQAQGGGTDAVATKLWWMQ